MNESSKESQRYQDMLRDVEGIVGKLSNQQLDLDEMVTQIEQGYALIKKMRDRLDQTKMTVESMRAQFEKDEPSDPV